MSTSSVYHFTFLSQANNVDLNSAHLTAADMGLPEDVNIECRLQTLRGGKQQGSKLITLTVGDKTLRIVPTRAMAVLDVVRNGQRFGWDSPVKEVVHPHFINAEASGGLGWLDGFNEMLVRCGYQWAGHPGKDQGERLSLHGRIQNTPASEVSLEVEQQPPYRVTLKGRVDEKRFKSTNYEVFTELAMTPDEPYVHVTDTLSNLSNYDNSYQAIYHNNFGTPILEQGASLQIAARQVSPFNEYAQQGLAEWNQMPAPTVDFDEMVFNVFPLPDEDGQCHALLKNANGDAGVEVSWAIETLPVLTIWKNTDTLEQGYVVGIEPGTSFAYNRTHQWDLGLVPTIAGKESKQFKLRFGLFTEAEEVQASEELIDKIQITPTLVSNSPLVKL
ncbi:aldose 1-epimerase family protein [Marinomonas ostreistagni]|uniref:aldose 1-epimerase family protein n=1 Tax=Marinomonas ostreistagni TaxID=359209 RepID=UPI00194E00DD|nr:aldose 1-epimerase family protein [Marinomonas ostreistagni]MBM6550843.1 aldose 1-epimerase family protein [Marinomonas ostreistagni]